MTTGISTPTPESALRRPALIAGISLLLLAIAAGWANLGVVERLVTQGDVAGTVQDVLASRGVFRLAIGALFLSVVLDVVIAWAIAVFLTPASQRLARLAGWTRAVYAALFAFAIWQLVMVDRLLSRSAGDGEVVAGILRYDTIWKSSLALFGIHLVITGWVALRSGYVPRLIAFLVLLSGAGYLADGIGTALSTNPFEISKVTFGGEVALMFWLLWYGVRPAHQDQAGQPPPAT